MDYILGFRNSNPIVMLFLKEIKGESRKKNDNENKKRN